MGRGYKVCDGQMGAGAKPASTQCTKASTAVQWRSGRCVQTLIANSTFHALMVMYTIIVVRAPSCTGIRCQ